MEGGKFVAFTLLVIGYTKYVIYNDYIGFLLFDIITVV